MGLIAHPTELSGITCSFDGKYLFTSGGADLSINMWDINKFAFAEATNKKDDIEPYLELLEGGPNGELHQDIIDYFYYCQLRTQGEDSMDLRATSGKIPLEQIPYLVRAIGFYPTEDEIANMVNEVNYIEFMNTGVLRSEITLVIYTLFSRRKLIIIDNFFTFQIE